jgi:hypothetical protein
MELEPAWSPDDARIAFAAGVGDRSADIYVMNADGSGVVRLTADPGIESHPSWGPAWTAPSVAEVEARVTHTIEVGPFPNAIAVGEGAVWVSAPRNDGSGGGDVVRIDAQTAEIVARIPVDELPGWEVGGGGMAVGAGSVWVSGTRSGPDGPDPDGFGDGRVILTRIEPASNEVADVLDLGPGDGADVWVDDTGIWVLLFTPGGDDLEVLRLDPGTYDLVARIPIPGIWSQQLFGASGSIWVHTHHEEHQAVGPSSLYRIDPAMNAVVDKVEFDEYLWYTAPTTNGIWVRTLDGVVRVDAATGSIVEGPFRERPRGSDPFAVDSAGGVWLHGPAPGGSGWILSRLDPTTGGSAPGLRIDERDASPVAFGSDPSTTTLWIVHYRRSISRVQLSFP